MDGAGKCSSYATSSRRRCFLRCHHADCASALLSIGYETVLLLRHNNTRDGAGNLNPAIDWKDEANVNLATVPEMVNNITSMLLVIGANMISRRVTETSLY